MLLCDVMSKLTRQCRLLSPRALPGPLAVLACVCQVRRGTALRGVPRATWYLTVCEHTMHSVHGYSHALVVLLSFTSHGGDTWCGNPVWLLLRHFITHACACGRDTASTAYAHGLPFTDSWWVACGQIVPCFVRVGTDEVLFYSLQADTNSDATQVSWCGIVCPVGPRA